MRTDFNKARRWVIKVGSSLVTNNGLGLDMEAIAGWADQLVALQKECCSLLKRVAQLRTQEFKELQERLEL